MFDYDTLELEPLATDAELYALTQAALRANTDDDLPLNLPSFLEDIKPGPMLAAILSRVDRSRLSGQSLVLLLQAEAKQASHYQGGSYASMAEIAHRTDSKHGRVDEATEFASDEIRAALRLTRYAANFELDLALNLMERVPTVWEALHAGTIDQRRARVISQNVSHLDAESATKVVDQIIDQAAVMTTGQLSAKLKKLCLRANPEDAMERLRQGLEDRKVHTDVNPDGTANLMGLQLSQHRTATINRRIDHLARSLKTRDDSRTMDQIRADVFLDLLLGVTHDGKATSVGSVNLNIDLTTLAGLDEEPGELQGIGPIASEVSREVAAEQRDGTWTYTVTDNGRPVATGTLRRRPTAPQNRHIVALHPRCVFPGCRMPASDCDFDHRDAWADGGPTAIDNIAPLCRHDHRLKHNGWHMVCLPNGTHQFTSPLGQTYLTSGQSP